MKHFAWIVGGLGLPIFGLCYSSATASFMSQRHLHDEVLEHQSPWTMIAQTASNLTNQIKTVVSGNSRSIQSNGIPNHPTGTFPNPNNPNQIKAQNYHFKVPLNPTIASQITKDNGYLFGVALNGVVFDPGTGELWNNDRNWRYEALSGKINLGLDQSHAHVQPGGAYHYHGSPDELINRLGQPNQVLMLGYAADGFPIYSESGYTDPNNANSVIRSLKSSYRIKQGQRAGGPGGRADGTFLQDYEYVQGLGDLDQCNGRRGVTPDFPQGIYYYVVTSSFPFVPRCFRGTPDSSFKKRRLGQGGQRPSGQRPGGPRPNGQRPNGPPPSRQRPGGPPPHGQRPGRANAPWSVWSSPTSTAKGSTPPPTSTSLGGFSM